MDGTLVSSSFLLQNHHECLVSWEIYYLVLTMPDALPRALRFHLGHAGFFSLGSASASGIFTCGWGLPSIQAEEIVNDAATYLYLWISGNDYILPPDGCSLDQPRARTPGFWDLNIFYRIRVVLANQPPTLHLPTYTHTHTHTHTPKDTYTFPSPFCSEEVLAGLRSLCNLLLNHALPFRDWTKPLAAT